MSGQAIVVVSGLPASGKSTLAAALAERIGADQLSRDETVASIRSRFDLAFEHATGRRRCAVVNAANERMLRSAADSLGHGRTVVVDVVADRNFRDLLTRLAASMGTSCHSVEMICSNRSEYMSRLHRRKGRGQAVVERLSRSYEPAADAITLDSSLPVDELVKRALDVLLKGGSP